MTAASLTFNSLERHGYSVLADASRAVAVVMHRPMVGVAHYVRLNRLGALADEIDAMLREMHTREVILALKTGSEEDLERTIALMAAIPPKIESLRAAIRSANLGRWTPAYVAKSDRFAALGEQLRTHVEALSAREYGLILLTERAQAHLLTALANPPEPSEALRRAVARHRQPRREAAAIPR